MNWLGGPVPQELWEMSIDSRGWQRDNYAIDALVIMDATQLMITGNRLIEDWLKNPEKSIGDASILP